MRRPLYGFLKLCLILQATIPVGYMPGSLADGTWAVLCPGGLSAEFVAALSGDPHAHHAHHAAGKPEYLECDLGGGVSVFLAATAEDRVQANVVQDASLALAALPVVIPVRDYAHAPRSPPRFIS